MKCADCGVETYVSYTSYGSIPLCDKCYDEREHMRLEEKSREVKEASDFYKWRHRDLSELFWMHLGTYIKAPNEHSLSIMCMAYRWACHDNVGLANSFYNALKWAKIDLYGEQEKWRRKKRDATLE